MLELLNALSQTDQNVYNTQYKLYRDLNKCYMFKLLLVTLKLAFYFHHMFLICSSDLIEIYQAGKIKISLNSILQSLIKLNINSSQLELNK